MAIQLKFLGFADVFLAQVNRLLEEVEQLVWVSFRGDEILNDFRLMLTILVDDI